MNAFEVGACSKCRAHVITVITLSVLLAVLSSVACGNGGPTPLEPTRGPEPTAPIPPEPKPPAPPLPAPPTGIVTIHGSVREPGAGPLHGVSVRGAHGLLRAVTDSNGRFSLESALDEVLSFEKEDYRFAVLNPSELKPSQSADVRMQRIHTAAIGSAVHGRIFPDDPGYTLDLQNMFWEEPYFCMPCRFVRVQQRPSTTLRFELEWTGSQALRLIAGAYYGNGPTMVASATPGASTLTGVFTSNIDVALVGLGPLDGAAQTVASPIDFTLTIGGSSSVPSSGP